MTEPSQSSLEKAIEAGKKIRQVRSFVLREGRLTNAQEKAITDLWPTLGIDYKAEQLDLAEQFSRTAPIVLEIGFGMGASLVEMAANEPDKDFIGIEVHKPGVGACLKSAGEQGVTNIRLFEHDGVEVLDNMIADASLERVQLFFPDPWPKKRHHKRRIVQEKFVQQIAKKLVKGGVFHMATDWENYAEHMLEVMSAQANFNNQSATNDYVERPDNRPLTKFEQRGHRLGHGVWDLMFEKK